MNLCLRTHPLKSLLAVAGLCGVMTITCSAAEKSPTPDTKPTGKTSKLKSLESEMAKINTQNYGKNIIFASGFEEGAFQFLGGGRPSDNNGPTWAQAQFQSPEYSASFVSQPKPRSGNKALRFEWRTSGLAKTNTSKKAMIHYGKSPLSATTDRWYGFSFYVSSNEFKSEEKGHALIFQLHATPDFSLNEPWRVPPVSLSLRDGQLRFWHTFDHDQISPKNDNIRPNGKAYTISKQTDLFDHWTDVVVRTKFSLEKKGIAQVWIDGKQVLDIQDIDLGYNDVVGPYPSWGLYSYKGPERRVIYFDEITIGDQNATYVDVAPGRLDHTQHPLIP